MNISIVYFQHARNGGLQKEWLQFFSNDDTIGLY